MTKGECKRYLNAVLELGVTEEEAYRSLVSIKGITKGLSEEQEIQRMCTLYPIESLE